VYSYASGLCLVKVYKEISGLISNMISGLISNMISGLISNMISGLILVVCHA